MIKKLKEITLDAAAHAFVYGFLAWVFLSLYTSTMNPIKQVDYLYRDVQCKIEGGFEWEAGDKGCYKIPFRAVDSFKRAFGG